MKKFYFLFLFALIVSIGNLYAAEKTVTYKFTSKTWEATCDGVAANWTSIVPADAKYNAGPCASNPKNHPSAESPITYTNIKKIDVAWKTTSITGSIDVYVGSEKITTISCEKNKNLTTSISPTTTKSGKVKFVMTTTGANLYLKSIAITYEEVAETKCATPTFNLENGKTYTDAQTLVITSTTADATIHYTINGGEEKIGQPAEFTENGNYTVDAWATKDGLTDSEHASITFTIDKKCAAPTFSLASGSYTTAQAVTITGPEGSTITYTLNDDIFDAPSPVNVELPLVEGVSTTYNLSALASMKDFKDSEETKAVYVINELYADKTATLNIANYASANKWVDGTQYPDVEIDDVKFAINGGGIDGKYYESNKTWRVYASNSGTLTISVPAMHIISSVVYKAANAFAKADSGTLSKVTTGEWKWDAAATNTTEGDPVNSVIFTAGNKKNVELKEIKVYYAYDPVSSVSSMSSEGVKVVAAEGGVEVVAEEAAEVAVYTAAGQLVRQARVAEGSTLVNVAPGFYVVRANGTATKVIVR